MMSNKEVMFAMLPWTPNKNKKKRGIPGLAFQDSLAYLFPSPRNHKSQFHLRWRWICLGLYTYVNSEICPEKKNKS